MAPSCIFRELESGEELLWEGLVRGSPQGSNFHLGPALEALAAHEHPVATVRRVGAFGENGALLAGWAVLVRQRGPVRYSSHFPLFYAGPMLVAEWCGESRWTQRIGLLQGLAQVLQEDLDILDTEGAPGLPDTRGLTYAGCVVEQIYTHVWPVLAADEIEKLPDRTKRREIRKARQDHEFVRVGMTQENLALFDRLHDRTLQKFKWNPPVAWRRSLLQHTVAMGEMGLCQLFAAREKGSGKMVACVSVLLSEINRRAWLWRVGSVNESAGLVPALYQEVVAWIWETMGEGWTVNFGGSPRPSLARFKDFLGAQPVAHTRIQWQRANWKSSGWNLALEVKEQWRRWGVPI